MNKEKVVPITLNFNQSRVVGKMILDEGVIPDQLIYDFEIGGVITKKNNEKEIEKFELKEVSIVMKKY